MAKLIAIDKAWQDAKLLGAALGPPDTWGTWLAALKAGFGLNLSPEERITFKQIAGNREPPKHKVAQLWAIAGRGSGKSRIAAAVAVYRACLPEHDLDPGEVGSVLVLAGSRDQAGMVFGYAEAFLRTSPILRKMIQSVTAHEIKLTNNVVVAVHTNSFRLIRGRTLLACVFDEIAFWRDEVSANPDLEVYRAVRPSLVRTGGMLIGISSPYRRAGLLFSKFKDFYNAEDDDTLVVQGATAVFNPTIDAADIAKEMAADPEGARSEWMAEFRMDVTTLLSDTVIEDATDHARPLELPPRDERKYHAFTDASAGRHDAFTLAIGHMEGKGHEQWVCDVVRGHPAPFNPRTVAHEYAALARSYRCRKVTGDAFAGEWVAAAFRDAGIEYAMSPLVKSQLYIEALPSFNRGAVALPAHDLLLRELRCLERRVHKSGRDTVDHPKHGSDDYANAVAGALYMAIKEGRKKGIRWGTIDWARTSKITWHDADESRPQLRIKHVDENGNELPQRGPAWA
jgi:hypothetical protein